MGGWFHHIITIRSGASGAACYPGTVKVALVLDSLLAADDGEILGGLFLVLAGDRHALFVETDRLGEVFHFVIGPPEVEQNSRGGLIALAEHRERRAQGGVGLTEPVLID